MEFLKLGALENQCGGKIIKRCVGLVAWGDDWFNSNAMRVAILVKILYFGKIIG